MHGTHTRHCSLPLSPSQVRQNRTQSVLPLSLSRSLSLPYLSVPSGSGKQTAQSIASPLSAMELVACVYICVKIDRCLHDSSTKRTAHIHPSIPLSQPASQPDSQTAIQHGERRHYTPDRQTARPLGESAYIKNTYGDLSPLEKLHAHEDTRGVWPPACLPARRPGCSQQACVRNWPLPHTRLAGCGPADRQTGRSAPPHTSLPRAAA